MWIIQEEGREPVIISNSPKHKIAKALKENNPDAVILRSLRASDYRAFAALAHATKEHQAPPVEQQIPRIDPETGEPVTEPGPDGEPVPVMDTVMAPEPVSLVSVGNTYALEDSNMVVRSPEGTELLRVPLEVIE